MPNHVKNVIKMKGITNLPLFSKDEDGKRYFDFNKLIPMPESMNLTSGSSETVAIMAALDAIKKSLGRCNVAIQFKGLFNNDLEERIKSHISSDWNKENTREELIELGLKYITNAALYGSTSWYDWCRKNWGTKWNAYSYEEISENEISFETAWCMPEPVVAKLAEMYPEAEIEHWWADEDMGNNSGYMHYENEETYGGFDETDTEAYETYVKCWGATNCLYKDEDGYWQRRNCEECSGCD